MEVTSIQDGIIIDHVPAGTALKVLEYLRIDPATTKLALIMNTTSRRYGSKDIIKIEDAQDVDLDVLGLVARQATVDIITCVNPRCVTTTEPGIDQVFYLDHTDDEVYRCRYCDEEAKF